MKKHPPETLVTLCNHQAKIRGNETAFLFEDKEITYRQFDCYTNQVANGLIKEGVKEGTRVGYLAKDSICGFEILFGTAKAAAVLITVNWRLSAKEILYILNNGAAEVLFVGEEFFDVVASIAEELITVRKIICCKGTHGEYQEYVQWKEEQSSLETRVTHTAETPVVQMYTSGTTGSPKGVQLAHYSFFSLLQGMYAKGDAWMNLESRDTLLLSLPMFHIGGLWWAIQGFIVGAKGIVLETFIAWKALEYIEKLKVTKVAMVPAMVQFVLAEPAYKNTDFSSVTGFLYGGSPITPAVMRIAMKTFDCDFFQVYGMTETGNMAVCLRPEDHTIPWNEKMKSAGKPLPGVEAKVINFKHQSVPPNTIGEICLKSPSNMIGYWNNTKATQETMIDGWIHTGDAGYIDEDGYIFICDRIKDMIICSGENIYPAEIEAVLSEHPSVKDVAVIGIPDDQWGEVVKAIIVVQPEQEIKKRALINFCRGKIADYKIPSTISFVPSLPRNPSGKILKRELRAPFWKGLERQVN
ncbi:fatty acid--CoA ligase [Aquimarina hainanensis]|uniref:Fatty acid--CoA ligase n=1 Tax=Aquimarina hainanensis TaxID=1578017 RepID=A0ABW5N9T5_9FLAO|nr:fatty acid--CoA ligase [Aquimarina sp. TRL1]QKX03875.1 fatty acid--CoA ligase [Aquimarina sp. TRL1]